MTSTLTTQGQAVRVDRARVRKAVATGRMTVAAALAEPAVAAMHVVEVVGWQHGWGHYTAERWLYRSGVCTPWQTAGNLTDRQRAIVARELRLEDQAA